jgi:hypothetical protein
MPEGVTGILPWGLSAIEPPPDAAKGFDVLSYAGPSFWFPGIEILETSGLSILLIP